MADRSTDTAVARPIVSATYVEPLDHFSIGALYLAEEKAAAGDFASLTDVEIQMAAAYDQGVARRWVTQREAARRKAAAPPPPARFDVEPFMDAISEYVEADEPAVASAAFERCVKASRGGAAPALAWFLLLFTKSINDKNQLRNARLAQLEAAAQELREELAEQLSIGLVDCGVFRHGDKYERGHACSHKGAFWVCQRATTETPGQGATAWRLAQKAPR
jgi:hypothetical protein